jgi:porin-like protein
LNAGANSSSCSPNFSFYQVGSRTQWNITRDFYMGVDVTYTHLNTAYQGANNNGAAVYPSVAPKIASTVVDDQSIVSAIFRAQMNFEARNEGTSFVFGQR